MKINKTKLIIASIIILLPIIFGVIVWDKLPETVPTHFDINGEPDGYSSRGTLVFVMPIVMLALFYVAMFSTRKDKRNKEQNEVVLDLVIWLVPAITIFVSALIYTFVLYGTKFIDEAMIIFFGLLITFIGNYSPKIKANRTIGLRVFWTLKSDYVWERTHRLSGKMLFFGGILMIGSAFLPDKINVIVAASILALIIAIPLIYSAVLYNREKSQNKPE